MKLCSYLSGIATAALLLHGAVAQSPDGEATNDSALQDGTSEEALPQQSDERQGKPVGSDSSLNEGSRDDKEGNAGEDKQQATEEAAQENADEQQQEAREAGLGRRVTSMGGGASGTTEYNEAYQILSNVNSGLPDRRTEVNRSSPQATLENFMVSARAGDFALAAQSLNLNLVPPGQQSAEGEQLAREFYHVLSQKVTVDWDMLPDRADGQIDLPRMKSDPLAGVPRRSIEFGSVTLDGRDVELRVQRVKAGKESPIWLISSNTVENIVPLYEKFGPSDFESQMPGLLRGKVGGTMAVWEWIAFVVLVGFSLIAAWLISKALALIESKTRKTWVGGLMERLQTPVLIVLTLLFVLVASETLLSLGGPVVKYFTPLMLFLLIAATTWTAMKLLGYVSDKWGLIYEKQLEDSQDRSVRDHAQSVMTRLSVARRVLLFLAMVIGASVMMTELELMESFGGSLVLSAGVLTLVVGFAARNVLGNILAGIQIAVAQPIRIGDSVLFEGTWGWVEQITYTFVGIRTWKKQRLVVPLEYFVSHPFENWTMKDSHLIKEVHLRADYTVPVGQIRAKFEELLKSKDAYDETVPPTLQVTEVGEETVDLRLLASAKDPSTGWDLHCEVREEMLDYLQSLEGGKYLPKRRLAMISGEQSSEIGKDQSERGDEGTERR